MTVSSVTVLETDINVSVQQVASQSVQTVESDINASVSQTPISVAVSNSAINASVQNSPTISVSSTQSPISVSVSNVTSSGGGGTTDHAALSNLSYADSGHIGFQASLTADVDYLTPATATLTYQPIGSYLTDAPSDGTTYGRNNGAWSAITSGITNHALLSNLDYASSGHTGFQASLGFTPAPTTRLISTTSPLSGGGDLSADRTIVISQAGAASDGYLSSTDWNTFNNKQATVAFPLATNLGGTGIANAAGSTLTLGAATSITGGGTLALGGFTLTVPATGTAALLATANVFTAVQKINANSTNALLVEQDGVKDNVFVVDTTNALVGVNTTSLFGGITVMGGQSFTALPAYGVASIGTINSTTGWVGNGFLFSNATSGSKAFSMVYNGDIAYFGALDAASSAIWFSVTAATFSVLSTTLDTKAITSTAITATGIIQTNKALTVSNASTATNGISIANSSAHDWRIWARSSTISLVIGTVGGTANFWEGTYSASPANLFTSPAGNTAVITEARAKTTLSGAVYEVSRLTAQVSTASTGGAAGFGPGQSFYAETATDGTNQQQGLISTSWIDATNATRKAKMSLSAYDTAARLGIEIEASGTEPKLGFYGVTTVARQVLATGAGASADDIIVALQNLGLVKQA